MPCSLLSFPLTLILYHTFAVLSRGFEKIFQKFFRVSFALTISTGGLVRLCSRLVPLYRGYPSLLTLILYHNERGKSTTFVKKSCTNLHRANPNFLCKLPGPRPGRSPVRAMYVKEGLCDPLCKVVKHCACFVL